MTARTERSESEGVVDFVLPLPDANDLQLCQGQLLLLLVDQLRAQVQQANQLQAIPLKQAEQWGAISGLSPAMAFEYAYEQIKATDVVNVGMHRGDNDDMVEENVALVGEILGLAEALPL